MISAEPSNATERKSAPTRLLQIEDNPEDVDLFSLALRKFALSLEVIVASDAEQAFSYLRRTSDSVPTDLILLDLNLPKMDGRDVLAEIKRDERLKVIPVLVFTTSNSNNDVRACYHLGAACYFVKPVEFTELVDLVGKIFDFWCETEPPSVAE